MSVPREGDTVELVDLHKTFDDVIAVNNVNIRVPKGEFLTFLGPSGCGKSTTLNMIAGFIAPTSGEVRLNGQNVTHLPPQRRDSAMVFQDYALFPHMTVKDNVAYGLRTRKVHKEEIGRRVEEALRLVGLEKFAQRLPAQLSGGQQQRVALARAVVVEPSALLLDEPLSNLDLKLREELRLEIRRLQRRLDITTIFVTHDQAEALSISDRIVVMRAGEIEQIGTPEEIYRTPSSAFVAAFIGQSNVITLSGTKVEGHASRIVGYLPNGEPFVASDPKGLTAEAHDVTVMFRPEAIRAYPADEFVQRREDMNVLKGYVREIVYLGSELSISIEVPDTSVITCTISTGTHVDHFDLGAEVMLEVAVDDCLVVGLGDVTDEAKQDLNTD